MSWRNDVRQAQDDVGYFVGLQNEDGTYRERTLSTPDEARADAWLRRILCHGFLHHTEDCEDCRES